MIEPRTDAHPADRLRSALDHRKPFEMVEAYDCMTARLAQEIGFDGILVGVGAIANFAYGLPDVGLLELAEALEVVRRICDSVTIPVVADVDDAGRTPLHIRRTVSLAERAGVAGIMVEDTDSTGPKLLWNDERCDWDWQSARMHPPDTAAERIRQVVASRRDRRLLVIARTDSLRVEPDKGLDGALARARLYASAGADVVYPLGLVGEQMSPEIVASIPVPILFAKPGGIDSVEREHLRRVGVSAVFHALVPRLSPYLAYKRTIRSLKNAERAVLDGPPWEMNRQVLETLNLRDWTELLR